MYIVQESGLDIWYVLPTHFLRSHSNKPQVQWHPQRLSDVRWRQREVRHRRQVEAAEDARVGVGQDGERPVHARYLHVDEARLEGTVVDGVCHILEGSLSGRTLIPR